MSSGGRCCNLLQVGYVLHSPLYTVWRGFVGWVPSPARKPCRRFRRWNGASITVQEDRAPERLAERKIE